MKNNRSIAIGVAFFSVIVIIVLVVSLLNVQTPQSPAQTTEEAAGTALTPAADLCADENISNTVRELEKRTREFDDIYQIASITPSTELTPLVVELTRVRRSAEDYQAPACLSLLKEYQIGMMNSYLQALMALLSALQVQVNPLPGMTQEQYDQAYNAAVSQYYALAGQHLENAAGLKTKYELEKSRLLGVTPVPTPTTIIIAPQTPTP